MDNDWAQFDFTGDVPDTHFIFPLRDRIVPAIGKMGTLRVSKSNGTFYKGNPEYPVRVFPNCLVSIEKIGRLYYYTVKTPLKGGYWRDKGQKGIELRKDGLEAPLIVQVKEK